MTDGVSFFGNHSGLLQIQGNYHVQFIQKETERLFVMSPKVILVLTLLVLSVLVDFTMKALSIGTDALLIGLALYFWKPWNQNKTD